MKFNISIFSFLILTSAMLFTQTDFTIEDIDSNEKEELSGNIDFSDRKTEKEKNQKANKDDPLPPDNLSEQNKDSGLNVEKIITTKEDQQDIIIKDRKQDKDITVTNFGRDIDQETYSLRKIDPVEPDAEQQDIYSVSDFNLLFGSYYHLQTGFNFRKELTRVNYFIEYNMNRRNYVSEDTGGKFINYQNSGKNKFDLLLNIAFLLKNSTLGFEFFYAGKDIGLYNNTNFITEQGKNVVFNTIFDKSRKNYAIHFNSYNEEGSHNTYGLSSQSLNVLSSFNSFSLVYMWSELHKLHMGAEARVSSERSSWGNQNNLETSADFQLYDSFSFFEDSMVKIGGGAAYQSAKDLFYYPYLSIMYSGFSLFVFQAGIEGKYTISKFKEDYIIQDYIFSHLQNKNNKYYNAYLTTVFNYRNIFSLQFSPFYNYYFRRGYYFVNQYQLLQKAYTEGYIAGVDFLFNLKLTQVFSLDMNFLYRDPQQQATFIPEISVSLALVISLMEDSLSIELDDRFEKNEKYVIIEDGVAKVMKNTDKNILNLTISKNLDSKMKLKFLINNILNQKDEKIKNYPDFGRVFYGGITIEF